MFDEIIERRGTGAIKYDAMQKRLGRDDLLPLWVADMDFRLPEEVINDLHARVDHGVFGYAEPTKAYEETLTRWFATRYGYEIDPTWNTITPGVVFAIACAIRATTETGDHVLIQQPVYYPFAEMIAANDRKVVNSELIYENGAYRMDVADFEKKIVDENVKLFILCSPHNPVGRVWRKEELEDVAAICKARDVTVIADEIHCDFIYPDFHFTPYLTISSCDRARTILCTAPSKTFNLAGLQLANILIPDEKLRLRFRKTLRATGYGQGNAMGLAAAQSVYEKGAPWLRELLTYLRGNLDFLRAFLEKELPEIKLVEPEGTYLAWLDMSGLGLPAEDMKRLVMDKARLWLDDGEIFGAKSALFERVNLACPRSALQEACERLRDAVRS